MKLTVRRIRMLAFTGVLLSPALASLAGAAALAPRDAKAVLEYTIDVEGKASASNRNGEYQQWSTRRSVAVQATLVALQPSVQDPGDPGGLHRASRPPTDRAFQPSAEMQAWAAELQKCGSDMGCRRAWEACR